MKQKKLAILCMAFALAVISCKKDAQKSVEQETEDSKTSCNCDLMEAYPEIKGDVIHIKNTQTKQEATFVKKGDKYILGGDMIFNENQFLAMKKEIEDPIPEQPYMPSPLQHKQLRKPNPENEKKIAVHTAGQQRKAPEVTIARTFTSAVVKLWPNRTVFFTIHASLPDQNRVTNAIAHWETNTNIDFVPRTNQADYIEFVPGNSCSSPVGRQGGRQTITLDAGCLVGQTMHEIGHAIGFFHEHQRADRNDFVTIHTNNIQQDFVHNFSVYSGTTGFEIGTLDFNSIMMYGSDFFTANGLPTITQLPNNTTFNVQRNGLSAGDIETYNYLYNPPFALNNVYLYTDTYDSDMYSYGWNREGSCVIEFFSDAAKTQPFTLQNRVRLNVTYYESHYGSGVQNNYTVVLPPGQNSYYLGGYFDRAYNDYGTWLWNDYHSTYANGGVGYRF